MAGYAVVFDVGREWPSLWGLGLVMSGMSLVDWWSARGALRDGACATVEGRVHGYDSTRWRGHQPRFAVGTVRLEVPSSLTQKSVGDAIRDGAVVRVTYVDPPLVQGSAGPTVLRIELRD